MPKRLHCSRAGPLVDRTRVWGAGVAEHGRLPRGPDAGVSLPGFLARFLTL